MLVILTAVISGAVAHARVARRAPASTAPLPSKALQPSDFPSAQDFELPRPVGADQPLTYQPFRARERRWTQEEIRKYWVAPRDIAIDLVSRVNDQAVSRLFQDIP